MMTRLFPAFLFFLLLLPGTSFSAETPALTRIREVIASGEKPVRIVCFGDSVTGIYYHTGGRRAYAELLDEALARLHPESDVTVLNAGISGHTSTNGLARLQQHVLVHKPHLVTVMFGLNDVAKSTIELYRKNLVQIVTKCRAAGAEVILCTPNAVSETPERPVAKVAAFAEVTRSVAREFGVPLCDPHAELGALRENAPETWRLSMSDEIHPNLRGHRRLAESLARVITGGEVILSDTDQVPEPLQFTLTKLKNGAPIKVLAMPPFDTLVAGAFGKLFPNSNVSVIPWPTTGMSRYQLMKDAAHRVRPLVPDLVIVAAPRTATAKDREEFIRTQMWIASNSLSRGKREWDVLVVHPDVFGGVESGEEEENDALIRQIAPAQDLALVDRGDDDTRGAEEILREWIAKEQ